MTSPFHHLLLAYGLSLALIAAYGLRLWRQTHAPRRHQRED